MLTRAKQRCGNCNAFAPLPNTGGNGLCRAKPPILRQIMIPNPGHLVDRQQPPMQPADQGVFPPIHENAWCREWGSANLMELTHGGEDIPGIVAINPDSPTNQ